MNGTSALIKKAAERSFPLPPGEDTARRRPSVSQEVSPQQTPGLARLQNREGKVSVVYKPPCLQSFLIAAQTDSDTHPLLHDLE